MLLIAFLSFSSPCAPPGLGNLALFNTRHSPYYLGQPLIRDDPGHQAGRIPGASIFDRCHRVRSIPRVAQWLEGHGLDVVLPARYQLFG